MYGISITKNPKVVINLNILLSKVVAGNPETNSLRIKYE